jgi:hypothetical protein
MARPAIFAARPFGRAKADTFAIGLLSARRLIAAAPMREMEWRTILPFTNRQPMID